MKMKKTFKFLTLTVLLSMVGAVSALAANLIGQTHWDKTNTVRYKILAIDRATKTGKVSVIGSNIPVATTTELTIPDEVTIEVNGELSSVHYEAPTVFSVTKIEKNAFATLSFLETLNIPASVEVIDEGAFNNAVVLENVNIEAGSQLKSVGDYVFGNTNIEELDLSMCSKLNLCEGTPFLNAGGQENHQLVTVKLPKEIECIGNAFTNITNLKNLDLGGTKVYTLDPDALDGTSIEEVVLGRPTEMTVATVKIDCNALPKTIKKLVINGDIATADAICAQPDLKQLTEVQFNGDLDVKGAVPTNVFPDSPLQKLSFNNIKKAGAIAPEAFKDKKNLSAIDFNGDIAAGGIGANAFESAGANLSNGSCATVNFKGELKGAAAIGYQAFWKAGIDVLTFKKDIAAGAIADEAFYQMTKCGTDITFEGELLGANAIGKKSFAESWVTTLTFAEPIAAEAIEDYAFQKIYGWAPVTFARLRGAAAIGEYAFGEAKIGKTTFEDIASQGITRKAFYKATFGANNSADVEFNGRFDGTKAIQDYAFEGAGMAHLLFAKDIQPDNAIGYAAFADSKIWKGIDFNGKLIGYEAISSAAFQRADIRDHIIFKGDIEGEMAIGNSSFKNFTNGATGKTPVTFNGSIVGKAGIATAAFENGAVSKLTIDGSLKGEGAIAYQAFANNTSMTEFTLKGEVANEWAISKEAFAGNKNLAKIDLQGNIYTAQDEAIAPFAFQGVGTATTDGTTVNFGAIKSSEAVSAGAFSGAKLNDVNYKELMAEKAIADNQFSASADDAYEYEAATIKTVNFTKELKAYENTNPDNANLVGNNAFTGTKVEAVNFKEDVSVKYAIVAENVKNGPFAYNGAAMTVKFDGGVVREGFGKGAFAYSNTKVIRLNDDAVYEALAFTNYSFAAIADPFGTIQNPHVDIYFEAPTAEVARAFNTKAFYKETDEIDILFHTTKDVQDRYTQAYNATDVTPYRLKFICTKVINLVEGPVEPDGNRYWYGVFDPQNEQYIIEKYQDNGPVNVYSAYYDDKTLEKTGAQFKDKKHDKYKADLYINPLRVQDHGKYVLNAGHTLIIKAKGEKVIANQDIYNRDGGVQTFAGLNAWACNDLRWNPAQIYAIEKQGVLLNRPWPGYIGTPAIDNGDIDWYGNVIRDYQVFRQGNFATQGVAFGNSISIPEEQAYILVTSKKDDRIKYSGYDHNEDWFDYYDIPWEESLADQLEDAYNEGWDDSEDAILANINSNLDEKQDNIDDAIEELILESFGEGVLDVTEDNAEKVATLIGLADELAPIVAKYYKAQCDLRVRKMEYDQANPISCVEEDSEFYGKNFSDVEDELNGIKAKKAEEVETPDDLYTQYKNLSEDDEDAAALKEELDEKAADDKELADAYAAAKTATDAMNKNEHAAKVWSDLTFDQADYTFTSYADEDMNTEWATGSVKVAGPAEEMTFGGEATTETADFTPITVVTNSVDSETWVGKKFYIKATTNDVVTEGGMATLPGLYELYTLNDETDILVGTGIYVSVSKVAAARRNLPPTTYTGDLYYVDNVPGEDDAITTLTLTKGEFDEDNQKQTYSIVSWTPDADIDLLEQYGQIGVSDGVVYKYQWDDEANDGNGAWVSPEETVFILDNLQAEQQVVEGEWTFVSYGDAEGENYLAEGTANAGDSGEYQYATTTEVETIKGTPVTVLENTVDGFVGNTYYINAEVPAAEPEAIEPINNEPIQGARRLEGEDAALYKLFTKDAETGAFSFAGIYVTIEPAEGLWVENYSSVEPNTLNCLIASEKALLDANVAAQKALAAKLDDVNPKNAYDETKAEEAAAAAEESAEAAEDWAWLWYTKQVRAENFEEGADEIHNYEIAKRNHDLEKEQKEAQEKLDELQALECYAAYAVAKENLGTPLIMAVPAIEDNPDTPEDESRPAIPAVMPTGAYLAVYNAMLAKNDKVKEVKAALNAIETGEDTAVEPDPARLNIIWTDRDERNDVVGIMDAVVNGTAKRVNDGAIYNLNGMRVKNAGKGIYIQNGKKYIK